ncbi:MAG: GNAT family N-acetyltransferase [bacterium]|nr:GNAT family N-acetyltransferase [bacterium]
MSETSEEAGQVQIRQLHPKDYPAVKEIVARSFEAHIEQNSGVLEVYEQEPWYDPEHLLVAEVNGQVVSQMGVRDGNLWVEGHPIPAGLVGTVCTLPEFRGLGIGAKLLRASFEWMRSRKIAMSYLHTSEARHGFYGRLGYQLSAIEQPRAVFRPEAVPVPYSVFRAGPEDAEVLRAIYEAHFGQSSGAWSRTSAFWQRRLEGKPKLWFLGRPEFYLAGGPAPVAYVALVREPNLRIVEVAALSGEGAALRSLLGQVLQDLSLAEVEVIVGPQDPCWGELQRFGPDVRVENGNVFVRVEEEQRFLAHAASVLGRRVEAGRPACEIEFEGGRGALRIGKGSVGVRVKMDSLHVLCALVYNGSVLSFMVEAGAVVILEGSQPDVQSLFVDTHPVRCQMDGY